MNANDINILLQLGERITFECKKAEGQIPKSVWETYSSFANTIGGTIMLGVKEYMDETSSDKRFEITGVANPQKMRKEFFDTLNSNKVNCNILTDADVEIIQYQGYDLLCIHVPQADYRQRPIYINGNIMNGSFKRNYEGDYHCTEDDVKAMIRDANDSGNDSVLMENYTMDDIDAPTLAAYRNRFRTANPDHVWNDYSDREFLLNTAITEDNISNYRIQQLLGKNPLEAGRILYALVDKGMLLSNNRGRWTSYSINSDYSQGVKNSRSKTQGVKSREKKKKEIRDALIDFCREARTLQEIADYLGYADRNRMKRVYIDPILGELLEMTSSESKNSPNQKYITKTK